MPKTVGEIMTRKVLVLNEEDNLERLEEGMERYGLRHLPVVDDGKLVGIVSHRDLLRVSVSTLESGHEERNEKLRQNTFASEIMTRDVTTIREDMELAEAAKKLLEGKGSSLPVVDEDDKVVGIITDRDFVKLAAGLLEEDDD
jgi:CBS domain-containing protein